MKKAKKMQAKVAQQSKKVPDGAKPESDSADDSDDDDDDDDDEDGSDEGDEVGALLLVMLKTCADCRVQC